MVGAGSQVQPLLPRRPGRGAVGLAEDRALLLAGQPPGARGRLRARHRRRRHGQVGDAARARRAPRRAARRRRRHPHAPAQPRRGLLPRARRALRNHLHREQPLGRLQGAAREVARAHRGDPDAPGAAHRRGAGDVPRGALRAARADQYVLRFEGDPDGGARRGHATAGDVSARGAGAARQPDARADDARVRDARGAARLPRASAHAGRQREARDAAAARHTVRARRGQLPRAAHDGRRVARRRRRQGADDALYLEVFAPPAARRAAAPTARSARR